MPSQKKRLSVSPVRIRGSFPSLVSNVIFAVFIVPCKSKSLQMVIAAMKLKDAYSLEGKL